MEKPGGGVRSLLDRSRLEPSDQLPSLGPDFFQLVLAISVDRQLAPGALGNPEISISCFEDGARELRNVRRQESPFPQANALSFQGTRRMRKGSFEFLPRRELLGGPRHVGEAHELDFFDA